MKAEQVDFQASLPKPVLFSCLASAFCTQPSRDPFLLALCHVSFILTDNCPNVTASLANGYSSIQPWSKLGPESSRTLIRKGNRSRFTLMKDVLLS